MNQSVLISGGGIVGAFLGMELASRNIPFTIVEKNLPTPSEYDEIRSLTLNSTVIDSRVTWFTTGAAILLLLAAVAQSVRRVRRRVK